MNRILISLVLFFLPRAAFSGSEYAFGTAGNCGGRWPIADTGQTVHYSTAVGDDSDYRPGAAQPGYVIYNPVGGSLVTADDHTGLMWIMNPDDAGMGGNYTWGSAISACEGLGYANYFDWRLPNIKELASILDFSMQSPSISVTYFTNTKSDSYWSSTTFLPGTSNAWTVNFNAGTVGSAAKTSSAYVRCVRGGA